MTFQYLKFLNVQYWYCIIYSLFGGKCAPIDAVDIDAHIGIGDGAQFGSTTGSVGNVSTTTPDVAAQGGLFHSVFETLVFVGSVLGGIFSIVWSVYSALAYTVSGILILLILASASGLFFIRYRELTLYGTLPLEHKVINPTTDRWRLLLENAMSTDPKRWRDGILSADVMLGELLHTLGYEGLSTADLLRNVKEGAFVTLPAAWEAHRIRNFVSARSSNYILTQRESFRVMKLYEQVFEEFDFI
jgi:hypothetical protein